MPPPPQPAPAAADAPDRWVRWLSVRPGPITPGDSFIVTMQVENKGHAPALGPAAPGYVIHLNPGEAQEYQAKILLPKDIQPGKYWLAFTVDPFNRVAEPQPHPDGEHDTVTNSEIKVIPR